jgi:hypothetical protein
VEPTGVEPVTQNAERSDSQRLTANGPDAFAQPFTRAGGIRRTSMDAAAPDSLSTDADLAKVIGAWPELPEPLRAGIVAMVNAAARK